MFSKPSYEQQAIAIFKNLEPILERLMKSIRKYEIKEETLEKITAFQKAREEIMPNTKLIDIIQLEGTPYKSSVDHFLHTMKTALESQDAISDDEKETIFQACSSYAHNVAAQVLYFEEIIKLDFIEIDKIEKILNLQGELSDAMLSFTEVWVDAGLDGNPINRNILMKKGYDPNIEDIVKQFLDNSHLNDYLLERAKTLAKAVEKNDKSILKSFYAANDFVSKIVELLDKLNKLILLKRYVDEKERVNYLESKLRNLEEKLKSQILKRISKPESEKVALNQSTFQFNTKKPAQHQPHPSIGLGLSRQPSIVFYQEKPNTKREGDTKRENIATGDGDEKKPTKNPRKE